MNGSESRPVLSVIIPVHNECMTIRSIIKRVMAVAIDKEIIVIDDGSHDGTREILRDIVTHLSNTSVHVITREKSAGKGSAIRIGVQEASGEFVVIQDADLGYDPRNYHTLLRPCFEYDADVVYGSRFVSGDGRRVLLFWHAVGNHLLTLLSNAVTNLELTDMRTGYKLFRREVIQSIQLEQNGLGFDAEITARIARRGLRIFEVGISYVGHTASEGKRNRWREGLTAARCILRYGLLERLQAAGLQPADLQPADLPRPASRAPVILRVMDTAPSHESVPTSH